MFQIDKVITKIFMFCIEAEDPSTHDPPLQGQISNEEQVFMFMTTGSSCLALAGRAMLP